ncbi:hypothetical protein COU57_05270 [Candidatus Pacearchaeota archaeon CG10_big_fil_rev_8_21_14_0_10_32_14]|nr:MAG: hypothetical protein COU57_05270 [Candidatus Pacearchaeota archaeon CG10_big_fil_rev_8_21_14_0_10_32_14]
MKKRVILFVCTGNIFRSLSAERILRKYMKDNEIDNYEVISAGTVAKKEPADPVTLKSLNSIGIDASNHIQTKLSRELLAKSDVVVAMADYHLEFMKKELGYPNAILFNELVNKKKINVDDINDVIPDFLENKKKRDNHIKWTIDYIDKNISKLFEKIEERFFLFEDFALNKNNAHKNGYPRIFIYETKNVMAFMSIDIPSKSDGHILVVPKKRYASLGEVPNSIKKEMIEVVGKIGGALRKVHGGYNVLLNDGIEAGQYIFHTHFHIVPRDKEDDIKIEVWKHRKISEKEFVNLNERLKKLISKDQNS